MQTFRVSFIKPTELSNVPLKQVMLMQRSGVFELHNSTKGVEDMGLQIDVHTLPSWDLLGHQQLCG